MGRKGLVTLFRKRTCEKRTGVGRKVVCSVGVKCEWHAAVLSVLLALDVVRLAVA
jgi:hypothetical protein